MILLSNFCSLTSGVIQILFTLALASRAASASAAMALCSWTGKRASFLKNTNKNTFQNQKQLQIFYAQIEIQLFKIEQLSTNLQDWKQFLDELLVPLIRLMIKQN